MIINSAHIWSQIYQNHITSKHIKSNIIIWSHTPPHSAPSFLPSFVGVLGAPSSDPEITEKQAKLTAQLDEIETYLSDKTPGPYLGGEGMCSGDFLLAPRLHAMDVTLKFFK